MQGASEKRETILTEVTSYEFSRNLHLLSEAKGGEEWRKKWLDEEYEFEVEVAGYLREAIGQKACAATVRRLVISIPVPMAVQ